jgi:hypothetical protein
MQYVAVYFTMLLTQVLASAAATPRRIVLLFWCTALAVLVGTREWTGCDFGGYLNRFNQFKEYYFFDPSFFSALFRSEPGFSVLLYLVVQLGLDYMWLNISCAVIFFICLHRFVSKTDVSLNLLTLSLPILIIQLAMSGIRQATAVAFLMLAWNAFREQRKAATAFWILAASSFHVSAIVFLPTAFVIGHRPTIPRLAAATLICLPFAVYFAGERIDVYSTRYGAGEVDSLGAAFRVALLFITAVLFYFFKDEYLRLYPNDYDLMLMFATFSLGVTMLLFVSSIAAHRVGYYLVPVQLLTLARFRNIVGQTRRNAIVEISPYVAYGLYIVVWFGLSRHAQVCYVPYETYLF